MKIIILGGNAVSNRPWMQKLANRIAEKTNHGVYTHSYKHWQTHAKFIDIDYELQTLAASGVLTGDYIIIAKSMGSVLALKGVHAGLLKPVACVFLGFPLEIVREADLPAASWIAQLQGRAQFIQNKADPLGSYTDVAAYLTAAGVASRHIVQWQGATHEYADVAAITSALQAASQGLR